MDNSETNFDADVNEAQLDALSVWGSCLSIIQKNIKSLSYKTWFEPIRPVKIENSIMTIQVPSAFFYEWIEEHYYAIIQSSIHQVMGPDAKLEYNVVVPEKSFAFESSSQPVLLRPANGSTPQHPNVFHISKTDGDGIVDETNLLSDEIYQKTNLNPKYTFDNFIKGDGNQFARAASINVANNPGSTAFNPLFLYGGVGLGKTHLIHAIGNAAYENKRTSKIIYMQSEKFTTDFVEAIQMNKIKEFSDYFKNVDILIIDDIQFFSGKERTQDSFFHTFNILHQLKKQIILSSDRPPKDIQGLGERLISRFQWGLTVDIQPPDFETRLAILRMRCEQDNTTLPQDVLEYMAANVKSNIRELEGCYITLIARNTFDNRPFDLNLAEEVLRSVTSVVQKQLTVEQIQKLVADHFKISENLLRAKTRKQEIVLARQTAMYLSKTYTSASLKTIGLHFGGRDHSTVIHSCQNIFSLMSSDQSVRNIIQQLEKQLNLLLP